MKNGVFSDVPPSGSCKNRCLGGTYRLHFRVTRIGEIGTTSAVTGIRSTVRRYTMYYVLYYILYNIYVVFLRSVLRLLVTANVAPISPIFVILIMEAIYSSDTSVRARATA
jgi:hypothetical protein